MERKEKLIRVLQILELTDAKSPLNAAQIVSKLSNEYNIDDVNRRSIYRDVVLLQSCGYEIAQCKNKNNGWYMEKHVFSDWEIKIMMDAVRQAKCITAENAIDIRKRLLLLSSDRGRKRFAYQIMPKSTNMAKDEMMGGYIELMLEAMFVGKKIKFQYTELDDKLKPVLKREGHIYLLSLYTLVWSDNNYYLIGSHDNHDGLTNYRLDRIRNLEIFDEPIIQAKDKIGDNPEYKIQEYIEKSVDHFSGQAIHVEVEYEPTSANKSILYDFAGDGVRILTQKDGKCRAMFSKLDSVTLVGWFTEHATKYKVVSPEALKMEVIEALTKGLEHYNS